MKIPATFFITLLTTSLMAADVSPKEAVADAAKKLGEQSGYAWKQTITVPESNQFKPGPSEGKFVQGGDTYFTFSFGDNTTKVYLKDGKAAVHDPRSGWRSSIDLENEEGPGRFISFLIQAFRTPSVQAAELADGAKELKKEGDTISGDLTEAGARAQFRFGDVSNPKGSVKFWINEGQLAKFQFKLSGMADFGGNEVDLARETTVEIKDVNSTKIELPDEAKKILEPAKPS
ncbi:MAG TPA: hypothetical protein PKA41_13870, partial [Verrucomicrobiota bacterium]|nr:hypothetical protein [Verrucomicrobiota bacterium]